MTLKEVMMRPLISIYASFQLSALFAFATLVIMADRLQPTRCMG